MIVFQSIRGGKVNDTSLLLDDDDCTDGDVADDAVDVLGGVFNDELLVEENKL